MTEQYLKNDFTLFDELYADDAILNVNGEVLTKTEIMQGFSMHHMLYEDIAMPSFIETTFYDENNNNSVWSHQWGWWQGTSKNSGSRDEPNPLNASFKWVDGKIVQASWIYDPTDLNEEIIVWCPEQINTQAVVCQRVSLIAVRLISGIVP